MEILFEERLAHGILVGVVPDPTAADAALWPEERAFAATLGPARRPTWIAARLALHRALELLGAPGAPILPDPRGAPSLPAGWVGSLSHKPSIAVALAAPDEGWRVGVDVETLAPARPRIASKILRPAEEAAIAALADPWPAILRCFSVKEAIYKALDPFVRRYVAFVEVELAADRPEAALHLARGEGPFVVELSWRLEPAPIATARVRAG